MKVIEKDNNNGEDMTVLPLKRGQENWYHQVEGDNGGYKPGCVTWREGGILNLGKKGPRICHCYSEQNSCSFSKRAIRSATSLKKKKHCQIYKIVQWSNPA